MSSPIDFSAEIVVRRLLFEAVLPLWVAYKLGNSENYGAYGFKERAHVFNPHDWPLFTDTNAPSDLVPSRHQYSADLWRRARRGIMIFISNRNAWIQTYSYIDRSAN